MSREEQIRFHSDRATAELDMALDAQCIQAARAHYGLSALHVDRMRDLKRSAQPEAVRFKLKAYAAAASASCSAFSA